MKILIISPEPWGDIKLSKHHYAKAFADLGHEVFFLSGKADAQHTVVKKNEIEHRIHEFTIKGSVVFNRLRFRFPKIYKNLLSKKSKEITNSIGDIDLLISFERSCVFPDFKIFNAKRNIWFLADMPNENIIKFYSGMDEIYSVSKFILDKIQIRKPKSFIHHGCIEIINEAFIKTPYPKNIYYVGNLMMGDVLDRDVLMKVIKNHPDLIFNFVGPYTIKDSNIGGNENLQVFEFIDFLKTSKNCNLVGVIKSNDLQEELQKADAFIVCYNALKDVNAGSNSHKIMGYLQTGKPIISTNISAFQDTNLIAMLNEKDNSKYPELFDYVIFNWDDFHNLKLFEARKAFASQFTYKNNIAKLIS